MKRGQPLTRLAALGDLSPLRSAPRGEVVSGEDFHGRRMPCLCEERLLMAASELGLMALPGSRGVA